MCGIAGWISPQGRVQDQVLARMRDAIAHRGPDGHGLWMSRTRTVGLAHRRLSIIDLSEAAAQPMVSSDERAIVVYNGEIYNHRALRRDLEKDGCHFLTDHSDTEVILVGYRHWGLRRLLRELNGMFAFALYDCDEDEVYLVRDRLGIKPIYWANHGDDILFASEIKAFFVHGSFEARLNQENLGYHMAFRSLPAPMTLFEGVQKLAGGQCLKVSPRSGRRSVIQYWDPLAQQPVVNRRADEAHEELLDLLQSSVTHQLESDVPVGVFLSGGLDSNTLLALASRERTGISTFTAVYPGNEPYNESALAAASAKREGAIHHDVEITASDYIDSLISVAYHQDEPIAAPVCMPVFKLAQRAQESGVPVILAGEGSDELFIGYDSWLKVRDLQRAANLVTSTLGPWAVRGLCGAGAAMLSDWSRSGELMRRLNHAQPAFWGGAMELHVPVLQRILANPTAADLGQDIFRKVVEPNWRRYCETRDPEDVVGWMTYMDVSFRLPELILPRLDKMGMASSIEGRVPFLDHRIVEFVFSLPANLRNSKGKTTKKLLRETVSSLVPPSIIEQRRRGFQAPVREWKQSEQMKMVLQELRQFSGRTLLFQPNVIVELLERRDDRLYFGLVNFMLWYCIFVENVLDGRIGTAIRRFRQEHVADSTGRH